MTKELKVVGVTIKGAEHPLKEIFGDDFVFEIPGTSGRTGTAEQAGELFDDLLDAEQRLTTLTVLIAALASFETGDDASLLRDFMRQKPNRYARTEAIVRLSLRPRDRDMFRDLVQFPPNVDDHSRQGSHSARQRAQRRMPRPVVGLGRGRCKKWLRPEIVLWDRALGGSRSDG